MKRPQAAPAVGHADARTPLTQPLTLRQPTLGAVTSGICTAIRRLARGPYGALEPGDRLWIREPFRLARRWDKFSPTAAEMLGARCYLSSELPPADAFLETDQPEGVDQPLGKERYARNLLRVWHRHHCLVTEVRRERLKDVTNAEILAAGFASRAEFVRDWNNAVQVAGDNGQGALHWNANPIVVVLGLRYVAEPVAALKVRPRRQLVGASA